MKSQRFSKICPSNARYLFDAYSCQGKIDIARAIMEGELDYKDSLELIEIIYKCTLCGACDIMCKFFMDMEPLLIFKELRAKLIEEVKALPAHKAIMDSVKSYDNVWMQPRTKRSTWAKGLDVKDISKEKAEVLYYVGCTYAYNAELQRVARETVTILKKAGVNLGILGNEEVCCGSPVARIGDQKLFSKITKDNLEAFNNLGIDKVIVSCAGCYSTMKVDYPKIDKMNFKVLHATEYIDQLIKEGKLELTKEVPLAVTYHDPCHLGRQSEPYIPWEGKRGKYGRYEPPKELRRGIYGIHQPVRNELPAVHVPNESHQIMMNFG